MNTQSATGSDGDLFRQLHQSIQAEAPPEQIGGRRQRRHPYQRRQRIAPQRGGEAPEASEFVAVSCFDISRGGFSFLYPRRPNFTHLVAEIGEAPKFLYVNAIVRHCEEIQVRSDGRIEPIRDTDTKPSKTAYLVGCQFLDRVP